MKKVLVFAPISDVKSYILEKWIDRILNLTYQNYDILLVDNSATNHQYLTLRKKYPEINFIYYSPKGLDSKQFITECQEKARRFAITNNYDYLMSIECDVMPPLDCIEELMRVDADVACGYYAWGFADERKPLIQDSELFDTDYRTRNLSLDEAMVLADGNNHRIFGAGLGCALIKRRVFFNLIFRIMKNVDSHSDPIFFMDCENFGFKVMLNSNVFCKHINQPWSVQEEMIKASNTFKSA